MKTAKKGLDVQKAKYNCLNCEKKNLFGDLGWGQMFGRKYILQNNWLFTRTKNCHGINGYKLTKISKNAKQKYIFNYGGN